MARTSNNGGGSKTPKAAAKAPARRRSDKARQAATAAANDGPSAVLTGAVTTAEANGAHSAADVQRRAYELYVRRGCCDGYDKDDWYEAERQLRQQH